MRKPMRRTLLILLVIATAACSDAMDDGGTEDSAATQVDGKQDSLVAQIRFGTYENLTNQTGEFTSLELIKVSQSDLPAAHYEGRFKLRGAEKVSEGVFNVYRYGGTSWIRFENENGKPATASEKYAWKFSNDSLKLEARDGSTFALNLVENERVTYECNYGVDDSEFLAFDVSDPYGRTAAELLVEVSIDNLGTVNQYEREIVENAATAEGLSIEEYLQAFDDKTVFVYDLTWFTTAFEMIRGFRGDTEVGVIFDAGFSDPIALISDGDIMGCNRDGECDFSIRSSFPDSTAPLLAEPLATEIDFIDTPEKMSELMVAQLRQGLTGSDASDDYANDTVEELLQWTDDGGFTYYEGDNFHWLKWYGGDTEVGAFFEKGTANLVGLVGDGDVSACVVAE